MMVEEQYRANRLRYLRLKQEETRRLRQEVALCYSNGGTNFTRYRDDPVGFCRDILGSEPWEMQRLVMTLVSENSYVAVRSCHGSGKTWTAAQIALWFLMTRPGSCVITTAPTMRQVSQVLWRRLRVAHEHSIIPLPGRCLATMIDIQPDWYAVGMTARVPENFQGPHSSKGILTIIDEASGVAEWLYETVRGFMTEEDAHLLAIGNPNVAVGTFFNAFSSPTWKTVHISAFDVPDKILRRGWIEEMQADYAEDSPVYQVRVLGNFPTQGENNLFNLNWIEAAQHRDADRDGDLQMGVDVARFGTDESCIYIRRGGTVIYQWQRTGVDVVQLSAHVTAQARAHDVSKILVDDIGVGGGVVDVLKRQRGLRVHGVDVGRAARQQRDYLNLRMELYAHLADMFRDQVVTIPEDKHLVKQLMALTYEYTPRGKRKLVSKDELKRAGHGSPDRADALCLAYARYPYQAVFGSVASERAEPGYDHSYRRPT